MSGTSSKERILPSGVRVVVDHSHLDVTPPMHDNGNGVEHRGVTTLLRDDETGLTTVVCSCGQYRVDIPTGDLILQN